jgi:hypothetical protein
LLDELPHRDEFAPATVLLSSLAYEKLDLQEIHPSLEVSALTSSPPHHSARRYAVEKQAAELARCFFLDVARSLHTTSVETTSAKRHPHPPYWVVFGTLRETNIHHQRHHSHGHHQVHSHDDHPIDAGG